MIYGDLQMIYKFIRPTVMKTENRSVKIVNQPALLLTVLFSVGPDCDLFRLLTTPSLL